MDFYWGSGSPFAWRVMLALEIKKLPYNSKLLEFSKKDHEAPAYRAISPRGKVPALKDGEFVIAESLAIIAYLDRKYPETPLFGRTAEETGKHWQAISEFVSYVEPAMDNFVRPIFTGKIEEKADVIRTAAAKLKDELGRLEAQLANSGWLVGNAIGAADIAIYPFVEMMLRAAGKPGAQAYGQELVPLGRRFPAVEKWRARIQALPGYDRTYPPHWRAAA